MVRTKSRIRRHPLPGSYDRQKKERRSRWIYGFCSICHPKISWAPTIQEALPRIRPQLGMGTQRKQTLNLISCSHERYSPQWLQWKPSRSLWKNRTKGRSIREGSFWCWQLVRSFKHNSIRKKRRVGGHWKGIQELVERQTVQIHWFGFDVKVIWGDKQQGGGNGIFRANSAWVVIDGCRDDEGSIPIPTSKDLMMNEINK